MPTTREPLAIYQVAENLRECVSQRLEDTPDGSPDRSCVVVGQIAWDDCECGQLIVAIGETFFSSNFPGRGNSPPAPPGGRRCGPPIMVVQYTISMLRCAPSGRDDHHPPKCSELSDAAQVAVRDAHAILWGAQCCLRAWSKSHDQDVSISDFLITGQRFVGPEGMCQGSETSIQVGLINACPPCDEET